VLYREANVEAEGTLGELKALLGKERLEALSVEHRVLMERGKVQSK
jgi:hypothetical protein